MFTTRFLFLKIPPLNLKFFTSYILLLAISTACTKAGKNISITGIVRNAVTGQPYENVKVKLMRTDGGLPGGYKDVESFYTNSDGYFEIHHYGAYKNYYLGVDLDQHVHILGWFEDGKHVGDGRMKIEKGHYMNPVLEIVEFGELVTNIQNVNCEGTTDQMQFRLKTEFDEDYGAWSNILDGCYSYTSVEPNEVLSGYRYYELKITRPSGTSVLNYSIFIPPSGIAQIDLFY